MDHYFDTEALFSELFLAGYQQWVDYCTRQAITAATAALSQSYCRLTRVYLILPDGRSSRWLSPDSAASCS